MVGESETKGRKKSSRKKDDKIFKNLENAMVILWSDTDSEDLMDIYYILNKYG